MVLCVVNYNTTLLTSCAIMSVLKHCSKVDRVLVFDNSDREPFRHSNEYRVPITVLDNTKGGIINLGYELNKFPGSTVNGSIPRTMSIQYMLDLLNEPVLLIDSDILVKRDIDELIDESVGWSGTTGNGGCCRDDSVLRVVPFLNYINVPMIRKNYIRYYNPSCLVGLGSHSGPFDTGTWFYIDCTQHNIPHKEFDYNDYIYHLGAGSRRRVDADAFVQENRQLWFDGIDYSDRMTWISYHDDGLVARYNLKDDDHHRIFATHKDAPLENINYMSRVWCELVTLWYVYHNRIKSDVVGFSHYRRQISPSRLPDRGECAIFSEFGVSTPYEHYKADHHSADMDEVLRVLDRRYGRDNPYSIDIRNEAKVIGCNCFMTTWDDFMGLCDFLFPVLLEYSDNVGCGMDPELWTARTRRLFPGADEGRIRYQTRVVGFLAERLVSAYIHTHMFFYY